MAGNIGHAPDSKHSLKVLRNFAKPLKRFPWSRLYCPANRRILPP